MMRLLCLVVLGLIQTSAAQACGLALALGLDVSRSVDVLEYRLQLEGTARALRAPAVRGLLLERARARVPASILVYEWSGTDTQAIIVDWTEIVDEATLARLTDRLNRHARKAKAGSTAIGSAIQFAQRQFERGPTCDARTLDLSGDGKNNMGIPPEAVRDAAVDAGITINGLVVGHDRSFTSSSASLQIGEMVAYFQALVIAGKDPFVETALGFAKFEEAMVRKLVRELRIPVFGSVTDVDFALAYDGTLD